MNDSTTDHSELHCWLYVSRCLLAPAWVASAMVDIVSVSRPRNASLGVTGALLFTGSRFAQFLEGPADAVRQLRDSIARDARHGAMVTVLAAPRAARRFGDWSLAYAGPSLFVASQVDAVLDQASRSVEPLIDLLAEFASGSGATV